MPTIIIIHAVEGHETAATCVPCNYKACSLKCSHCSAACRTACRTACCTACRTACRTACCTACKLTVRAVCICCVCTCPCRPTTLPPHLLAHHQRHRGLPDMTFGGPTLLMGVVWWTLLPAGRSGAGKEMPLLEGQGVGVCGYERKTASLHRA